MKQLKGLTFLKTILPSKYLLNRVKNVLILQMYFIIKLVVITVVTLNLSFCRYYGSELFFIEYTFFVRYNQTLFRLWEIIRKKSERKNNDVTMFFFMNDVMILEKLWFMTSCKLKTIIYICHFLLCRNIIRCIILQYSRE